MILLILAAIIYIVYRLLKYKYGVYLLDENNIQHLGWASVNRFGIINCFYGFWEPCWIELMPDGFVAKSTKYSSRKMIKWQYVNKSKNGAKGQN